MPLIVRDGNGSTQNLYNTGLDKTVYSCYDNTITTSATSATDIYQFVGAAGVVGRLRTLEFWTLTVIATATTVAASSTLMQLIRRSAAGTTGTWTKINTSTTVAQYNAAAAASSITVNVAGNTAFTVGTSTGTLRRGFLPAACLLTTSNITSSLTPLKWSFGGAEGYYPPDLVGTGDFICVNLNGVTPIATICANLIWEEATF